MPLTTLSAWAHAVGHVLKTRHQAEPRPDSCGFFVPDFQACLSEIGSIPVALPGVWLIQDPQGEYARRLDAVLSSWRPSP